MQFRTTAQSRLALPPRCAPPSTPSHPRPPPRPPHLPGQRLHFRLTPPTSSPATASGVTSLGCMTTPPPCCTPRGLARSLQRAAQALGTGSCLGLPCPGSCPPLPPLPRRPGPSPRERASAASSALHVPFLPGPPPPALPAAWVLKHRAGPSFTSFVSLSTVSEAKRHSGNAC